MLTLYIIILLYSTATQFKNTPWVIPPNPNTHCHHWHCPWPQQQQHYPAGPHDSLCPWRRPIVVWSCCSCRHRRGGGSGSKIPTPGGVALLHTTPPPSTDQKITNCKQSRPPSHKSNMILPLPTAWGLSGPCDKFHIFLDRPRR